MKNILKASILFLLIFSQSYGDENLSNEILKNLRCLVCQGQTVHDSNSDFALTIKSVVKDKIKEGNNEREIYTFLSEKYGDWILLNPPLKKNSFLLWFLPLFTIYFRCYFFIFFDKKTKN